jgi:hypothetical protein
MATFSEARTVSVARFVRGMRVEGMDGGGLPTGVVVGSFCGCNAADQISMGGVDSTTGNAVKALVAAGNSSFAGGNGGNLTLTSGNSSAAAGAGAGGAVAITAGSGAGAGGSNGGSLAITAGASSNAAGSGAGGAITITAGNSAGAGNGGDVTVTPGLGTGAGSDGTVNIAGALDVTGATHFTSLVTFDVAPAIPVASTTGFKYFGVALLADANPVDIGFTLEYGAFTIVADNQKTGANSAALSGTFHRYEGPVTVWSGLTAISGSSRPALEVVWTNNLPKLKWAVAGGAVAETIRVNIMAPAQT